LNEFKILADFELGRMAGIIGFGFQIISGDYIPSTESVPFKFKSKEILSVKLYLKIFY
jgi:hypothetical protein